MTTYKRGDVVLVRFPESNLVKYKYRPALVVQADGLKSELDQFVMATITSNLKRAGYASRVLIDLATPLGQATGLLRNSVVMIDNLSTILESLIVRRLGILPDMTEVDQALRVTLAL